MSDIEDGGQAFPRAAATVKAWNGGEETEYTVLASVGMSIRDYFAAKAMQVILHPANERIYDEAEISSAAYSMADAMLKERAK